MVATAAQETDLWSQYLAHPTAEVREQLVLNSVPLVHYILNRMNIHRGMGSEYEDLVHQGLLGLVDAVDRYDPAHGTRFSTYAAIRVRGKILDYLRAGSWLSRQTRQRMRAIQACIAELWCQLQREPTEDEIAIQLGWEVGIVHQSLSDSSRVLVSLDSEDSNLEEDGSRYESLLDQDQPDPQELCAEAELKERLVHSLHKLSERERLVLSLYYYENLTLREIGQVLDISESRVCQLHARAILNIKALMSYE